MQIPIQQIDSPVFEIEVKTVKTKSYFRPDGRFSLIQKQNKKVSIDYIKGYLLDKIKVFKNLLSKCL